jgi:CheY-like chemotaxis protein/two-component sensor histidine kinase
MNAIVGMTAIAAAHLDDSRQVQSCLKKISLSSKHLLGLINDILDMSKIESGKMTLCVELVSLRETLDNIVSIVQPQIRAKKQNFDVFISDIEAENVYCDSVRLNQIILNLMSNAIKFTPEEGTIHIYLSEEESPVGIGYVRIHLRVKDSGIGMPPEFLDKIFDSFAREDSKRVHKTEGTGLGMAITKYIVDAMCGTIEVESEQGKGSEFHITLDLERALVREEDMVLPDLDMLVVDDDEDLCKGVMVSLEEIGIKAEYTLSGEQALARVDERHRQHRDFQIILLDWQLPDMDGIETARRIRRQMGADVPILIISAYDWSEIEAEAMAAGVTGFISKPLFKSTLFYGIKQFIYEGERTSEQEKPRADFTGKRVLVAEDNDLNWEIAKALLEAYGFAVERAEDGGACVDSFTKSEIGFYDAILMDVRMPVMSGYEATRAIRATERGDSNLPIIAMTADAFYDDIKRCIDSGMNEHIAKPVDVQELIKVLGRYI